MDERCKTELRASFIKSMEEETNLTNLLNLMLTKQQLLLNNLELYKPENMVLNRKKIVELTQFNYTLFNKLFSINMELESFWSVFAARQPIIECPPDCTLKAKSPKKADCLREAIPRNDMLYSMTTNGCISPPISKPAPSELSNTYGKPLNPLINNFEPGFQVLQHLQQSSQCSSGEQHSQVLQYGEESHNLHQEVQETEEELIAIEEHKSVEEIHEENLRLTHDLKPSSLPSSSSSYKDFSPVIYKHKTSKSPHIPRNTRKNSTETKFEKYSAKNRFERKYQSVVTELPDLSFIKDDSSSDYQSVPTTANNSERGGVKTPTSIINQLKIDSKDNFEDIPEHDLPNVNDICVVTYIRDPSEFYIALANNNMFVPMIEQMAEFGKCNQHHFKKKLDAKLAIGKCCIAYSKEFKSWNRALIIQWNMTEEENVDIQYVDFGEYATVKFNELIPIPAAICTIPKQTIRCSLPGLTPSNPEGIWSNEAIEEFTKLCYNNGEYADLKLVSVGNRDKSLAVDFVKNGDDFTCTERMFSNGHADCSDHQDGRLADSSVNFMVQQVRQAQGLSGICDADDAVEALDKFCNVMPTTHATMADAMMGYDAQDDRRLCRFTDADGTCFKGARCKLEHKIRRKDGVTTDTEEVLLAPESTFMPNVNDVLTVNITSFKSPFLMYGQVKYAGNQFGGVMREMFKSMNKPEMIASYETFKYLPAVGEFVIAKNTDDRWYRGTVLEISASHESRSPFVSVFFVDVGETTDVLLDNVRKMKKGFVIHPYQATQLRISNVKSLPSYSTEVFEQFAANYLFTDLSMLVKYAGGNFIDGVFTDESNCDVGAAMIRNNLAETNVMDYHPLRSSNILVD